MGLGDMLKNVAKQKTKGIGKKVATKVTGAIMGALSSMLITLLPIILITTTIIGLFDFIIEVVNGGENTPKEIYSQLEVEDLTELVEIKENSDGEYYLDFKENIDSKLEEFIDKANKNPSIHNLPEDKEFLKKIMKAELITKFPNLGGEVPEGSDGFQGAVKLRRVTPNKDIDEYKNTGKGDTTVTEEEVDYGTVISNEYIENVKKWKDGKKLELVCDAIVYKQRESELDKNSETGFWEPQVNEETKKNITISEGTTITYQGEYKLKTSPLTNETTIYVKVKSGDIEGYIKSQYLMEKSDEQTSEINTTKVANSKKSNEVSSRAKTTEATATKTAGEEGETYTIAIAAGHNNTDDTGASSGGLVEQELTIKVAEKVEELFAEYSNITVVQTGSTSNNPSGVKVGDRKRLAREANPDLCIQIHFNAGGGTGVEAIYKDGDGISQQLAEILSQSISSSMGLENRQAGPDAEKCAIKNLGIIENAASSGFPSVVTEGGFLDGSPDADIIENQDGITKYAQGIVNGVLEYLVADHSGYTSQVKNNEKVTDTIESIVQNMKYVPLDEFREYIKNNNKKVISLFTLDEDNKLLTATYSNGTFGENPATDFRTALQQYIMPYEYLLYFYIDTDYEQFSMDLADEVMKTEIVMVVQDNISTTKTTQTTEQKKVASDSRFSSDWTVVNTQTTTSEYWSTSIDVNYVDTWCVKAYSTNSFSTEALNMGNRDKIKVNIKGKVTETASQSETAPEVIESGTASTGEKDSKGKDIVYTYQIYQRIKTKLDSIENTYDKGEYKTEGNVNKFVKLYNEHSMAKRVRTEGYLFKILENEKTANLLNLTKYLIYEATGIDTGVIEYDFSEFDISSFSSISGIYGGSLQEKVWFALKDLGFTDEVVAGAMGNIDLESGGFSASAVESSGTGIGLVQWSFGRADKLKAYASHKGVNWTDEDTQIEYLIGEISGKGPAAESGFATQRTQGSIGDEGVKGTYKQWKNSKTVEESTLQFMRYFESPASKISYNQRLEKAKKYLAEFKGKEKSTGNYGPINLSAENKAKMQNMLDDAVRIANDNKYKYVYGAAHNGPSGWSVEPKNFDCSSFVGYLYYKYFNVYVGGTTEDIATKQSSKEVPLSKLQPGDILYRYGHVDMYLGNGLRVGAHSSATGIYWDEYKASYTKAFRIINK